MTLAGSQSIAELDPAVRYVPVAVAGAPVVEVCVDPAAGDPVATWFLDHDWIDEPVQRAFLDLLRAAGRGAKVLDLGCHLGTFSLPAAGLDAAVLAVDANPDHARLLRLAAARNGFSTLRVANVAVAGGAAAGAGPGDAVRFVPRSIHGYVPSPGEPAEGAISVPAASVDGLLAEAGWHHLDVVKMDIEGCEPAALRSMRDLFATGCRPCMVLESNGPMLALQGSSVPSLRQMLDDLGYELFFVDHLRPGVLVRIGVDTIQTEAASDIVAVPRGSPGLGGRWQVEPPFSDGRTVARLLDAASSPAPGYRRYAAGVLRDGPIWLRDHPAVRPALEALAHDIAPDVRRRDGKSAGHDHADASAPSGPPGEPVVVWAERLSVVAPPSDLERPPGVVVPEHELLLRELAFHLNRRELVAVLVDGTDRADALLRALEGQHVVAGGTLDVRGHVVSLRAAGLGLEPKLSVRDNAALFGAFVGSHVAAVEAALPEILAIAGLAGAGDARLEHQGSEAAGRLVLAVALSCTHPDVLLVGDLPPIGDGAFRAWVAGRCDLLAAGGTAVVQVAADPAALLIEPARVLWIEDGHLRAAGHAGSLLEEAKLRRLGFGSDAEGWRLGGAR